MLKIIYHAEPFNHYMDWLGYVGINEPCTKDLSIEFDQDASATEILNEVIKLLKYAGYDFIDSKSKLLDIIDKLTWDGTLKDDTEESQEN